MKLSNFIKEKPAKPLVFMAGMASAFFLAMALIGQYGFDLHPCELCVAQRVPYALIVLVSAIACLRVKSEHMMEKIALVCALLFLVDSGIAIYHAGVETGVFHGPSSCTNNDKPGASIEEMLAAIKAAQLVPCDQPMAYFFGLSMAAWNALAAIVSSAFVFIMLRKIRKGVHG